VIFDLNFKEQNSVELIVSAVIDILYNMTKLVLVHVCAKV